MLLLDNPRAAATTAPAWTFPPGPIYSFRMKKKRKAIAEPAPQTEVASAPEEDAAVPAAPVEGVAAEPDDGTPSSPGETDVTVEAEDNVDADANTDTASLGEVMSEVDPEVTTERIIEAVLFCSETPLPIAKLVSILGVGTARDVRNHIQALNERYASEDASFRIEQIAGGYQLLTLPIYNTWIRKLKQSKQDSRLSQAALETLAVVAYKQPVVRAEVEVIRGVAAGEMLNRLRELGLIKIVGRAEDVGRPMLYGTTKRFLEVFGLSSLEDLPEVEELKSGQGT